MTTLLVIIAVGGFSVTTLALAVICLWEWADDLRIEGHVGRTGCMVIKTTGVPEGFDPPSGSLNPPKMRPEPRLPDPGRYW